jgi:hypothetical protein
VSNMEIGTYLSTAISPIAGLKLVLPDICDTCGTHVVAVISNDAELHCTICAASRGRVGPRVRAFLN